MSGKALAERNLDALLKAGFNKATCEVSQAELHELQSENSEINLLRTAFETSISLSGIVDDKRAAIGVNDTRQETIDTAIGNLKEMADAASPDPAHDIAELQPAESFKSGIDEPDYDAMYDRIQEIHEYVAATYPTINLRAVNIVFSKGRSWLLNSNGIDFDDEDGAYDVSLEFSAKDGDDTSSLSGAGYSTHHLDTPIRDTNDVDTLLRQSVEQVHTQHIPDKFVGDLIISPHCLMTFVGFLTSRLGGASMIDGTSIYKDRMGEQVCSPVLNLHSLPLSDELTSGYYVTGDGYKADDLTIVDNGVLNTYLLNLFVSNKIGLPRSANDGGCYVIDPGQQSFDEMVADVREGIFINRFSGGRPNDRGDFSGVAKNSYYIRDGEIRFPIQETTVSGNLANLLQSIGGISRERLNSGASILPWIRASGVTAS